MILFKNYIKYLNMLSLNLFIYNVIGLLEYPGLCIFTGFAKVLLQFILLNAIYVNSRVLHTFAYIQLISNCSRYSLVNKLCSA